MIQNDELTFEEEVISYLDYFLTMKILIVTREFVLLQKRFETMESFVINYKILGALLNDEHFGNAFRNELKTTIYSFAYESRNLLDAQKKENIIPEDVYKYAKEAINEIIISVNSDSNFSDESRRSLLKKLLVNEQHTLDEKIKTIFSRDEDKIYDEYLDLLIDEYSTFLAFYKHEGNIDSLDEKEYKKYLKGLNFLFWNFAEYEQFEKKYRVRE